MSVTPFDDRGRFDEEALREHVRWLTAEGVSTVPASVSTGEGTLLTDAELLRTYEIVVEESAGRFPVLAANREFPTARENIEFARQAQVRGVDAVQVYPPTLGHAQTPTVDMLDSFYDEVLPEINLPVLVSNNSFTGFEPPLAVHERLVDRHENVAGFFKNSPDFLNSATFYARLAPRVTVLTGFVRLPMAFLLGVRGELDNVQNVAPRTCRTVHDALHAGDLAAAGAAYADLVRVIAGISAFCRDEGLGRVPVVKGILRALGRPGALHTRSPHRPIGSAQQSKLGDLVASWKLRELEGMS
ncbi:dihydrodipicolinate synthase family protein [uncultured Jatrophihabitans sp.]|uniref:dihydrodipicolinate synthase family protein n=1 Tax=uncultured Jatrophihabitans sp. TaxID=1610747 RepID=UPI0035CC4FFD